MTFRIREARIAANLTQQQLADMLNISYATLSGYETGAHDPKSNMLAKIADICKVTVDYLLGIDRSEVDEPSQSEEAMRIASEYDTLDEHGKKAIRAILDVELARVAEPDNVYMMLRHYEFPAAAGEPLDVENGYEMERYPAYDVPHGTDYTLNLNGESMEPDYPNGCTVYVKRTFDIDDGDVIIAWMEGDTGTTCKRVAMDNGRVVRLESINPNGPTFSGVELAGMQVYGKVIGIAEQG